MAEEQVDVAPVAVEKPVEKTKTPKKKAAGRPKKPAEHPKYAEMVKEALSTLKVCRIYFLEFHSMRRVEFRRNLKKSILLIGAWRFLEASHLEVHRSELQIGCR